MRYTINYIEARIRRLETNPVENAKLIKKWKRILRKAEANA